MNAEQQVLSVKMLPLVTRWARKRSRDDEYVSLAQLALCQAIEAYDPGCGASLRTCVWRKVHTAFNNHERVHTDKDKFELRCTRMVHRGACDTVGPLEATLLSEVLPERLHAVARMFFLEKRDLCEICSRLGLDRSVVKRMVASAENILVRELC